MRDQKYNFFFLSPMVVWYSIRIKYGTQDMMIPLLTEADRIILK